jgi:hypothetical protein
MACGSVRADTPPRRQRRAHAPLPGSAVTKALPGSVLPLFDASLVLVKQAGCYAATRFSGLGRPTA